MHLGGDRDLGASVAAQMDEVADRLPAPVPRGVAAIAVVLVLGFVCLRYVPRLRASWAARHQAYRHSEPAYFRE
jgi:hypothetical protein